MKDSLQYRLVKDLLDSIVLYASGTNAPVLTTAMLVTHIQGYKRWNGEGKEGRNISYENLRKIFNKHPWAAVIILGDMAKSSNYIAASNLHIRDFYQILVKARSL